MKNTVKKLVSLVCLIFVILSAAGCSDKNGEGSDESTKSETNADVTNHESNTDSPIHTGSDDDGEPSECEIAEKILDDFCENTYRSGINEKYSRTSAKFAFGKENGALFSRLGSVNADPDIVRTGEITNDAFYKVSAEPLSYAFAFLEWYKLNNSEIDDFNGIYFYWSENKAVRITTSEKYADMIAIDYAQYHMIIHSGTVNYDEEKNTKSYVISYGEDFKSRFEYHDKEISYNIEYDYDDLESFFDTHEKYLTDIFPDQAINFIADLYTDKDTGKELPVFELYQAGKKNHRFLDGWMKATGYSYIGMFQSIFMFRNYDEICDPSVNTEGDVMLSPKNTQLCVVPNGIKQIGFPINSCYGLVLPSTVVGFVDEKNIDTTEYIRDTASGGSEKYFPKNLEYVFVEAAKDEYENGRLIELIKEHFPSVKVLYKGEFDVICGVYVPHVENAAKATHVYDRKIATAPYYTGEIDENGIKFYCSCSCCGNHNDATFYMPLDYHTPSTDSDGAPIYSPELKCGMNHTEYACAVCGEHIHADVFRSHRYNGYNADEPCYYCGKERSDVISIVLDGNGVFENETIYADRGEYCVELPEYDETKYEFLGWFGAARSYNGLDTIYKIAEVTEPITDNTYLYAYFKDISKSEEKYKITLNYIGISGEEYNKDEITDIIFDVPEEAEAGAVIEINYSDVYKEGVPISENFFVDASLFRYDGRENHGCGIDDNQPHMYFTLYYDENIKAFTSPTSFVMPDCDVEITIERWNEYWDER